MGLLGDGGHWTPGDGGDGRRVSPLLSSTLGNEPF